MLMPWIKGQTPKNTEFVNLPLSLELGAEVCTNSGVSDLCILVQGLVMGPTK